jgi:hypothetical protein
MQVASAAPNTTRIGHTMILNLLLLPLLLPG